ncbi:CHAT domain-containing protein [bacterium]|nr:CHAT domain-containing protein [bacterium]
MAKKRATRQRASQTQTRRKSATRKTVQSLDMPPRERTAWTLNADDVETRLLSYERSPLLEELFGEESLRELQELARQATSRNVRGGTRVLILPGIMGSKLGYQRSFPFPDDTIWIDPLDIGRGNLKLLAMNDPRSRDIAPLGVILSAYLQLKLRLKIAGFHAEFFPFDWRKSLTESGALLKKEIETLTSQSGSGSYVDLVAHSMGGLVSRAALSQLKAEGQDDRVRRLVMLGTPNFGSFAPVLALRGEYPLVRTVARLDRDHTPEQLAESVFRTLPGLCQMLPFAERYSEIDLYRSQNWPASPEPPRQTMLNSLNAVQSSLFPGDSRCAMIAGVGQETITGVRKNDDGTFTYLSSRAGDGTVPLAFAQLPGVPTWYWAESHGMLPNNLTVIRATIELLERGTASGLLTDWTPGSRDAGERVWQPPEDIDLQQLGIRDVAEEAGAIRLSPSAARDLLRDVAAPMKATAPTVPAVRTDPKTGQISSEPIIISRRRQHRLDLYLARGDVTEVGTRAVVLGLFNDVEPSGAARAFDRRLDSAITEFTQRRMFSGNAGEVFMMPTLRQQLRTEMLLFTGLGSFDALNGDVLRMVAENAARTLVRTGVNDFATVLLGGNSAAGLADSLACLVKGLLAGVRDADVEHRMRSITICENDDDRFQMLHNELLHLATTPLFDDVELMIETIELPASVEAAERRRPCVSSPEPCYLFVRQQASTFAPTANSQDDANVLYLQSSVLSPSGKATVVTDGQRVDRTDLNRLLSEIEQRTFGFSSLTGTQGFGVRLAELVLPPTVRAVLKSVRSWPLVIIHDAEASRIPWEAISLDPNGDSDRNKKSFPAVTAGLSRKYSAENLSVAKWLEERRTDHRIEMLLVVDPREDLPGAREEGEMIQMLVTGAGPTATALSADSRINVTVVEGAEATWNRLHSEMKSGKYDVLHYAGHAFFDPRDRARSGIICHGDRVLSGADLAGVGDLPTLAFFNACEAARVRKPGERPSRHESTADVRKDPASKIEKSVSLAEAFLRGGIANYVGTYWPVGDAAAMKFAGVFYQELLDGQTISSAILAGRKTVFDIKSVDWADNDIQ